MTILTIVSDYDHEKEKPQDYDEQLDDTEDAWRPVMCATQMKKLFLFLGNFFESSNMTLSEDGLTLSAMNTTHTFLIELFLPSTNFTEYSCQKTETLGIDFKSFNMLLKLVASDLYINIDTEVSPDTFVFSTFAFKKVEGEGEDLNKVEENNFELKLLDISQEICKSDEISFTFTVSMDATMLKYLLDKMFGDEVRVKATPTEFQFISLGALVNADVKLTKHNANITIEWLDKGTESFSAEFSKKFLLSLCQPKISDSVITFSFARDQPMCATYTIEPYGQLCIFLAPRIEEEGEEEKPLKKKTKKKQ